VTNNLKIGALVARVEFPAFRYRLASYISGHGFRALPYQARGPERTLIIAGDILIGDGSVWTVCA
jgi:hypothetical protein